MSCSYCNIYVGLVFIQLYGLCKYVKFLSEITSLNKKIVGSVGVLKMWLNFSQVAK